MTTVEFSCTCGKQFRARADQGGQHRRCPSCGSVICIPSVALAPIEQAPGAFSPAKLLQVPKTFSHLLVFLLIGWATFSIVMFILSWFSEVMKWLSLLLFLAASVAVVQQVWKLMRARQLVLEKKDVPLLWGFVRLIAWDPIQGVLVLKNKSVSFSDDNLNDGEGGVRLLFPILGEELALRVPLEVQTLRFSDSNILTQEYLSVSIRGTMKWRIVDIRKFYLFVSRELRSTGDTGRLAVSLTGPAASPNHTEALMTSAIEWMRILAEEQTRMVVSRAKSGLLIADRLSHELPEMNPTSIPFHSPTGPASRPDPSQWGGATEGLASAIHDTIAQRLEGYGIAVDDVSLQEIKLPEEIVNECIAAAKAYYTPVRAQREASEKYANAQAALKAEVDVLGKEAVGTERIVGAAPAFALSDFLVKFLNQRLSNVGQPGNTDALAAAMIAGQTTGQGTQQQLPSGEGGVARENKAS